jgi:hypothetical protein
LEKNFLLLGKRKRKIEAIHVLQRSLTAAYQERGKTHEHRVVKECPKTHSGGSSVATFSRARRTREEEEECRESGERKGNVLLCGRSSIGWQAVGLEPGGARGGISGRVRVLVAASKFEGAWVSEAGGVLLKEASLTEDVGAEGEVAALLKSVEGVHVAFGGLGIGNDVGREEATVVAAGSGMLIRWRARDGDGQAAGSSGLVWGRSSLWS